MRVLIANSFYAPDVIGGAELSVQGIAEQMVALGSDVTVVTTGIDDEDAELNGVRVLRRRFDALMPYGQHRASNTSIRKLLNKPLTIDNPLNRRTISRVLASVRPQVVLTNNLLGITPQLWRSAHEEGIPIVHTTRDYALLCPNSTLICKRRVFCDAAPLPHCRVMREHLLRQSNLVSTVVAPSHFALDLHVRKGYFAHADAVVIPNAVRFDAESVRQALAQRASSKHAGKLRIAYLGRLIEEKGLTDLLDAMKMLDGSEVELHVAGSGPLEEQLRANAAEGVPICLHGFLHQDELNQLLLSCDVLVAPSRYAETFGRVVLDAYRNTMPAIVSDAGALPEVLSPGTGMVVPARDPQALAAAITSYIGRWDRITAEGARGASELASYTVGHQTERFLCELNRLTEQEP